LPDYSDCNIYVFAVLLIEIKTETDQEVPLMTARISVNGLSFFRRAGNGKDTDAKFIFRDLNLEIFEGDRVGLIGNNGVGKSTLLRLLSGILKPDEGKIEVRDQLTVLLDSGFGLDPSLSGRENARTMAILARVEKVNRSKLLEEIRNFSELNEAFELPVKTYSTGMVVRLVLSAQLILVEDTGLIIDEGFGTADAQFQKKTFLRIEQLINSVPFMVLASHNEEMLKSYCNRGIVIRESAIAFDGGIEEALQIYGQSEGIK
jgi:ABC-2 type transport system ATP-binding protein/lipopolysaccharide transport system ATP-binding protein